MDFPREHQRVSYRFGFVLFFDAFPNQPCCGRVHEARKSVRRLTLVAWGVSYPTPTTRGYKVSYHLLTLLVHELTQSLGATPNRSR
jgi:hypothetical protein